VGTRREAGIAEAKGRAAGSSVPARPPRRPILRDPNRRAVRSRTPERRRRSPARRLQVAAHGHAARPFTVEICERWGRIGRDQPLPPIDGLLAATAMHHGLTLVTRNTAHAERSGIATLNPFAE
jgi:predicted nucleic acid-binding protein